MKLWKRNKKNYRNNDVVVLLDIDGVVNPLGILPDNSYISVKNDWETWRIPYNVIEWLQKLDEEVEVIWASTWNKDSLLISRALTLRADRFINFGKDDGYGLEEEVEWFKLGPVVDFCETFLDGKLVVWIDDDLPDFCLEASLGNPNLRVFKPDAGVGLSEREMAAIDAVVYNSFG